MPPEIIKQMKKIIFKFLWKGPDKVTRLSVINTLENGGLNLTDFETHKRIKIVLDSAPF